MIRNFGFILYDPKKFFAAILLIFFFIPVVLAISMKVEASANGRVAPYSGGESISKVFYPADGSIITVTSSGAVIKQSPGHTAYREGWVSPCSISSYNSASDLTGHIASGASNPYSSNCSTTSSSTNSSTSAVAPYTGGANIIKVFYPADGSTITITCTGAVVKQSPGGNPYREGWINPANINNYHSASDLDGHIVSGTSSPYSDTCNNISSSTSANNNISSSSTKSTTQHITYITYTNTPQTSSTSTTTLPKTGPSSV